MRQRLENPYRKRFDDGRRRETLCALNSARHDGVLPLHRPAMRMQPPEDRERRKKGFDKVESLGRERGGGTGGGERGPFSRKVPSPLPRFLFFL